jgi:hypothetical protein
MQDIQIYSSHPALVRHFSNSSSSRPRDPFRTPEKKTKPYNHSPARKTLRYDDAPYTSGFEHEITPAKLFF